MREKKPIGEQGWSRLGSLLKAFRQGKQSLKKIGAKRSEDPEKDQASDVYYEEDEIDWALWRWSKMED